MVWPGFPLVPQCLVQHLKSTSKKPMDVTGAWCDNHKLSMFSWSNSQSMLVIAITSRVYHEPT